jgi:putative redox protein
MSMKASVTWVEGGVFSATSGSGHGLLMHAPLVPGQPTIAPSPMELVLIGTGGCTSVDVVTILQKGRQDVRSCVCQLDSERAETPPKVFTKINMHFIVTGKGLKPDAVQRAIDLSAEKYCSASIMLGKTANITHSFEIVDAG